MIKTTDNLFRVIAFLFSHRNKTYRGISKATKISVMGVSKIISKLAEAGIADIESIGRSKIPKLRLSKNNLEIFALAEKFRFNEFAEKHKDLKGSLLTLKDNLDTDFSLIFGSYASGEESTKSDLDLLIVSNKDNIEAINKAKVLLNVEVNPIFIKKRDFIEGYKKGNRMYREIVDGKRIVINGEYNLWSLLLEI